MPAVSSIRNVVESAIQRASNATGVDFTFLMGTAKRESGFNPGAKARTSSASGLFQFVDQTWLSTLKKHGAKYGYARYADLISQGADGRYRVEGDEAPDQLLVRDGSRPAVGREHCLIELVVELREQTYEPLLVDSAVLVAELLAGPELL